MTNAMTNVWAVLTGEYPPDPGGVSDYTRSVASALARAGDVVHVWTPQTEGAPPSDPGVRLHVLADGFTPRTLPGQRKTTQRGVHPVWPWGNYSAICAVTSRSNSFLVNELLG